MENPIVGNVFSWKDTTFTIAEDFSEVVIERDGKRVAVPPSALLDLIRVMEREFKGSKELMDKRFINFCQTTFSLPTCDL